MSNESAYLQKIREAMRTFSQQARELEEDNEDRTDAVVALVHDACDFEAECRQKFAIGARFNVIANQLQLLKNRCDAEYETIKKSAADLLAQVKTPKAKDETTVYVYVFNINGTKIYNWEKLLTETALGEHSVNRPIYANKADAERLIKSKPNLMSHAFIEVLVANSDITADAKTTTLHDALEQPLLKLKQRSLHQVNVKHIYHNKKVYRLDADGHLINDAPTNNDS